MSQPDSANGSSKKTVNWPKWRSLSILGALSLIMITQYQNCTNDGDPGPDEMSLVAEAPMPVSVINEVKSDAAVSFSSKSVQIHSEAQSAVLDGLCSMNQEGSVLGWKIHDAVTGQKLEDGFTRCENGHFQVELSPTQELQCDHEYRVSAQLGLAQPGEVSIARRCQPEAVADGSHLKAQASVSDDRAECVIERRADKGTGCSLVCYSESGVVESESDLEPAQCGL